MVLVMLVTGDGSFGVGSCGGGGGGMVGMKEVVLLLPLLLLLVTTVVKVALEMVW